MARPCRCRNTTATAARRQKLTYALGIEQTRVRARNMRAEVKIMRNPSLAAVLSLIVPGVGQLYNGRIIAGILWLILTPGFWLGTGGTLGWVCHIIAAYTAYSYAKEHPVRR